MKYYLLTLLLLLFGLSGFAQRPVKTAVRSGIWQTDTTNSTWGGKRPRAGDSIVIPKGVTVVLAKRPGYAGVNYYVYDLHGKPTKLTVSGTLVLGNGTNLFLYETNGDKSNTITVTKGGVIRGGDNGTHLKIASLDDTYSCEVYEGGIYDPNDAKKTAHPLVNGKPMIVGPVTISSNTPGACNSPLPITLVSFEATYQPTENRVKLEWLTASEINNDYFTVERSRDALHFQEVSQQPGAGNSSERLAYGAYDTQPLTGLSYYRLRQTDYDGQQSFSKIVSVTTHGAFSWRVLPNPSNGHLQLLTSGATESLEVRVFNSLGKLLYQGANAGWLPIVLSAGMYYVQVSKDGQASTQKVVVQ
jgi:hypothetical protein